MSCGEPCDYGKLSITQLKNKLRERNARLSGNKETLVKRLQDYDRNNNFVDDFTENETVILPYKWPPDDSYRSVTVSSKSPNTDSIHINVYFMKQYSSGVGLSEFEAVNRKGYSMSKELFMTAMTEFIDEENETVFYRAQVHSEMTKSLTYFTKVAIRLSGSIVQSECECAAGKGPVAVCKHAAVVCYAIEHFKETNRWLLRETVTQKKQSWHAPKQSRLNISPKKAPDLKLALEKPEERRKEKYTLCFDPRSSKLCVDYNARAWSAIINYTNFSHTSLGISTIFQVASTECLSKDHDYLQTGLQNQQVFNRI